MNYNRIYTNPEHYYSIGIDTDSGQYVMEVMFTWVMWYSIYTKTFGNTFRDMMRAKLRWFCQRSVCRYTLAIALITYGLHGRDTTLDLGDKSTRGILYFLALCIGVLLVHIVAAKIQSLRFSPRIVTFRENELVVNYKGESFRHTWDWVLAADESPHVITLQIQKMPRLELYLPRAKLNDSEYRALRAWLALHRKLPPLDGMS